MTVLTNRLLVRQLVFNRVKHHNSCHYRFIAAEIKPWDSKVSKRSWALTVSKGKTIKGHAKLNTVQRLHSPFEPEPLQEPVCRLHNRPSLRAKELSLCLLQNFPWTLSSLLTNSCLNAIFFLILLVSTKNEIWWDDRTGEQRMESRRELIVSSKSAAVTPAGESVWEMFSPSHTLKIQTFTTL